MKEKTAFSGDLVVRQDLWNESPCSSCIGTPCCRNLPLLPLRLNRQSDFIDLLLCSCYEGFFPALKKSGEWTIYLGRSCRYLDNPDGKCSIHKAPHQSMICKSYDAHSCWYTAAFSKEKFSTMISFDTSMMIWFEKRYNLIENRFDADIKWEELCNDALEYRSENRHMISAGFAPLGSYRLPFKKCGTDQYLFMPPYHRPEHKNHFELLSFRLGFPGVYLAVTDNCWAFLIKTELNRLRLELIRREYYPAIGHKDSTYSFDSIMKEYNPFSETGDQWIILQRHNLELLKELTVFDSAGNVRRLPSVAEILSAINTRSPDRAA